MAMIRSVAPYKRKRVTYRDFVRPADNIEPGVPPPKPRRRLYVLLLLSFFLYASIYDSKVPLMLYSVPSYILNTPEQKLRQHVPRQLDSNAHFQRFTNLLFIEERQVCTHIGRNTD